MLVIHPSPSPIHTLPKKKSHTHTFDIQGSGFAEICSTSSVAVVVVVANVHYLEKHLLTTFQNQTIIFSI